MPGLPPAHIRKMGLNIKTKNPSRVAAHHAYFGVRIEMMKQGYLAKGELHIYDVASAYPSAMVDLPSMRNGKWSTKRGLILFPSTGYGWYMRDDVLAAIAWLEKFLSGLP